MPSDIVDTDPAPPVASMDLVEEAVTTAPSYSSAAPSAGFATSGRRLGAAAVVAAAIAPPPTVDQMVLKLMQMGVLAIVSIPNDQFTTGEIAVKKAVKKAVPAAAPGGAGGAGGAAAAPAVVPAAAAPAVVPAPEVVAPGIDAAPEVDEYTAEQKRYATIALSAYEPRDERLLNLNDAVLDSTVSTDDLAVYVDKKTKLLHIGVRGTSSSNLLAVTGSVFGTREGANPTALEDSTKADMRKIRAAYPEYGIRYWGHSHGAQLISMMQEDGEKSTTWAGYILRDTGNGVDTNITGKNDDFIPALGNAHELRGGKSDIEVEAGHSLDSFVDGSDLAAYNARVAYQKKKNRTTQEVAKAAGTDAAEVAGAGEAFVLAADAVAATTAAVAATPEAIAAGAAALAVAGLTEAGGKVAEGAEALTENILELLRRAKNQD
jgi:hypothetical protein